MQDASNERWTPAIERDSHSRADDSLRYDAFFSLRKPRDLKAGISSGGKSVLKGMLAGTVAVLVGPVAGVWQDGWKGLPKGVALGIAGGVVLPITGVAIGVTQVVRGAINTPSALRESSQGRVWDQEHREWIDAPSNALTWDDDIFTSTRERWQASHHTADSEDLYLLLGVPRDASEEAIKRQYYVMARKLHPDKNPDDPTANERFQKISEAYQVLGNPDLRRQYDAHGRQALDVNFMDPSEFFTMLFGSDKFEHLIGELMVAVAARGEAPLAPAQAQKIQNVRVQKLAVMLTALLRRWVEGDEDGFKESMQEEGTMLATTSYGAKILSSLGHTYELQADIACGGLIGGSVAAVHSGYRHVKFGFSAFSVGSRMLKVQLRAEKMKAQRLREEHESAAAGGVALTEEERRRRESEQQRELEEAALPAMLDAMWLTNMLDIESTARSVCREVLRGPGVTASMRRARASGLKELGRIFQECAKAALLAEEKPTKGETPRRAKMKVEAAMQQAFDRRHS